MAINLPNEGDIQFPEVPRSVQQDNRELYEFLKTQQRLMQYAVRGAFDNTLTVATAVNSGISGTFVISSGGLIVVVNGIVTSVTS